MSVLKNEELQFSGPLVSHGFVLETHPARLGALEAVPESIREDYPALRALLDERGYLYLKKFFNPEKIRQFREYFFSALAETGLLRPGSNPVEGLAGEGSFDRMKVRDILFNDIIR